MHSPVAMTLPVRGKPNQAHRPHWGTSSALAETQTRPLSRSYPLGR